jgi:predicted membrane-bound spermidine synthase
LYLAFAVSGVAGLVYEVLWSRYLGLYVGHGAYAQVLVLAVYLGGMAVGGMAVSDLAKRLERPLLGYAAVEAALGVLGLGFHVVYRLATDFSYDVLFPGLGSAGLVGASRWAIAGALVLPQAILLGSTFPLMASGLVRADPDRPGGAVARAYLLNTFGGAAGVLLAGFWMIGHLGLPGTSVAAAMLNFLAALLAWRAVAAVRAPTAEHTRPEPEPSRLESAPPPTRPAPAPPPVGAVGSTAVGPSPIPGLGGPPYVLLYAVSLGTAVASFAYEIGWIRMLSLVLGSATHAFELMLSAFILGLALGAWAIRGSVDATRDPLRLLGFVQVAMGVAAVVSLPIYLLTFDAVAGLVTALSGRPGGYELFNLSRYALCLMVMLPATMLAGTTLPLVIGTLMRGGAGEEAIGRVYAVNTIGSVAGASAAGLVALPLLGLEGLIMAGAGLDVVLGLWVLEAARRRSDGRVFAPLAATAFGILVFVGVGMGTRFDPTLLTSGVYRFGDLEARDRHQGLYYADGRTATVSAHLGVTDGVIVLATNGKPDASIGSRWLNERRDTMPETPVAAGRDFTTQVLAPIVAMAHRPDAANVANIGHGSGLTGVTFLTSAALERLVTIEIEPLMVEGSLVFLPANAPAFGDPRATYVFDDAKSFFSYRQERFDIVFAEPSNPWVSGTASLFTTEFYRRVAAFMSDGSVFAQWMQIYELNDDLFASVVAAVAEVFPYYRAYLVGDSDVAIVAAKRPLADPDWSVLETGALRRFTEGSPPYTRDHVESLLLFDQSTMEPLLAASVEPNSDYRPRLDLGAERARFYRTAAEGAYSFGVSRVDLARELSAARTAPGPYRTVPAYGLEPALLSSRAAWLRDALAVGGGMAPEAFPEWQEALVHLQAFLQTSSGQGRFQSWEPWAQGFLRAEADLHWGTTGYVDPTLYRRVDDFLVRGEAPAEAIAVVDLMRGLALREWELAAAAADVLVGPASRGASWIRPELLLDVAVLAYLRTGRAFDARVTFDRLAPRTGRAPDHLRNRVLDAWIDSAVTR